MNKIIDIVNVVRSGDFYGGGKWIELAKGKNQIASTWAQMMRKFKRLK